MGTYNEAKTSAVMVDLSDRGRLKLTDRDRLDLIHRMSTNDLLKLKAGEGATTVLTTHVGRMIDMLTVFHDGEEALVITGRGRSELVRGYLQRNIFFKDKVQVTSLTESSGTLGLYGKRSAEILDEVVPGAADLERYHFVKHAGVVVSRTLPLQGHGFWLTGDVDALAALKMRLLDSGVTEADQESIELLRIEAGIPEVGHELTEDYIPLEAGLWDSVSFNKGCYTGQEIIARMESRGKLAKMLVRLHAEALLSVGGSLYDGQKNVGTVTSIAAHPDGHYSALGFVKTASAEQGITLATEDGSRVQIEGIAGSQPNRQGDA